MEQQRIIYDVKDRVPFGRNLLFAIQQFLAIIAATILVPVLSNNGTTVLNQSSALIGAGVGTIVYLLCTQFKSPVFLGSSFAFITPLSSAVLFGYFGVILGAIFAGLVYVILAIIIKFVGSDWVSKLMPPVIIGPTVALIGLSLSSSAMNNLMNIASSSANYNLMAILVGLVTFFVTIIISVKGGKKLSMFPFVLGVVAGYALAAIVTLIGYHACGDVYYKLIDFSLFAKVADMSNWVPQLTFMGLFKEGVGGVTSAADVLSIFVAFAPVALVVFAEHIADHKNISSIIGKDLLKDPGLHRTLLGDGLGTIAGAFFGGCPNTTYGESIGCVAITGNASVWTILTTAILCIIIAFFYPLVVFVETIPTCIVGGICIALYGFIAVSGLRMFKDVDLDNSKNLFIVATIFVTGLGGMYLQLGKVTISSIACALILGILVNLVLKPGKAKVTKTVEYDEPVEKDMFGYTQEKEEKKSEDKKSDK